MLHIVPIQMPYKTRAKCPHREFAAIPKSHPNSLARDKVKNLQENLRYVHRKSHSSKRGILEIATSALKARKRSETSSGQRSRRKGSGPSRKHTVYVKWTKDRRIGGAVHKIQWRTPSTTASGKVE